MIRQEQHREQHLVELVDADGTATGACTVAQAHRPPGAAHRAFSVVLIGPAGFLLQQRAAVKTRFALRWANACCGHPAPGEDIVTAAANRLHEELGITGVPLTETGIHWYEASDPTTARVEREYDHVLVGSVPAGAYIRPDPAEVAAVRWVKPDRLAADLAHDPHRYAPWLAGVLALYQRPPQLR